MKARLHAANFHGGEFGEMTFTFEQLGDDPLHALHSLAQRWLAGGVVQSGLAETQAPAAEDLRDRVRREVFLAVCDAVVKQADADTFRATYNATDNICRLIAERDSSRSRLAADVQRLSAQVDILRSQARQLTAAQASAEEKFEKIRVALRGEDIRSFVFDWNRDCGRLEGRLGVVARALDQIQRLLPPENVGPVVLSGGSGDASERSEES